MSGWEGLPIAVAVVVVLLLVLFFTRDRTKKWRKRFLENRRLMTEHRLRARQYRNKAQRQEDDGKTWDAYLSRLKAEDHEIAASYYAIKTNQVSRKLDVLEAKKEARA